MGHFISSSSRPGDVVTVQQLTQIDPDVGVSSIEGFIKCQKGNAIDDLNGLGATTGNDNLYLKIVEPAIKCSFYVMRLKMNCLDLGDKRNCCGWCSTSLIYVLQGFKALRLTT